MAGLSRAAAFLLIALVASPGAARAADAPASPDAIVGEDVRVERVRPLRPKLASMRFLRENRDFLRMRLDALRQSAVERGGTAEAIDPRFLAYDRLMAGITAAGDSVAAARDARLRGDLYADVADLSALDGELDGLERQLAAQRERLGMLEADFTGRQATALLVVLRGAPAAGVAEIALTTEDGVVHRTALTPPVHDGLARGGRTQVAHVYLEPRAQTLTLTLGGAGGAPGAPAYVTLDPARDRITFLELDLSAVGPAADATALRARAWLHAPDALATTR